MKTLAFILMLMVSQAAMAVFRCEINGKVEYRDTPCPQGKQTTPTIRTDAPTRADYMRAMERNRRAELDRIAEDQAMERARRRAELDELADRNAREMARRKAVRCDQMTRSVEWTEKTASKYRHDSWWQNQATNARENLDLECGR